MPETLRLSPVILVGVGEMGGVFARGLLRLGHPVYPVVRGTDMQAMAADIPDPALVLVAVGEAALPDVLAGIPAPWLGRLALLQNELLPADYAAYPEATVISVWFEKKKGQEAKVIIPSPASGPGASLLHDALGAIDIPVTVVDAADRMRDELVVKNLYILTSNIAGLRVGGNVGQLWADHRDLGEAVVDDVIAIQAALVGETLERDRLVPRMVAAFEGDPAHQCMGRSAPARLARALEHADRFGLGVPTLRAIAASAGGND